MESGAPSSIAAPRAWSCRTKVSSCSQVPPSARWASGSWLSGPCPSGQHPGGITPEADRPQDPGVAGPDLGGDRLEASIDAEVGHHCAGAGRSHPEELFGDDRPSRALVPVVQTTGEQLDRVLAAAHCSAHSQLEQSPHRAGGGGRAEHQQRQAGDIGHHRQTEARPVADLALVGHHRRGDGHKASGRHPEGPSCAGGGAEQVTVGLLDPRLARNGEDRIEARGAAGGRQGDHHIFCGVIGIGHVHRGVYARGAGVGVPLQPPAELIEVHRADPIG